MMSKKSNAVPKIDTYLKNVFPPHKLRGDALEAFVDGLRTEGGPTLHVWREKNMLLDNFFEFNLCRRHNIPYRIIYVNLASREEAQLWIVDSELRRRHLCKWHRCRLAIKYLKPHLQKLAKQNQRLSKGRGAKGRKKGASSIAHINVNDQIAARANVSRETVAKVSYIIEHPQHAPKGLYERLDDEDISIKRAHDLMRDHAKQTAKHKRCSGRKDYTNNLSEGIDNSVLCYDALESIEKIPDKSVSLCLSSPPFCVGKQYADGVSDSKPWAEHVSYLTKVFQALKPKFRRGGRCVIEYSPIRTREKADQEFEYNRPIHAVIVNMMESLSYKYRTTIIWDKGTVGKAARAWGSFVSPTSPAIRDTHSYLFVFSVDDWKLPCESGDPSELDFEDFDSLTKSIWRVAPACNVKGSHPCPMPVELAERVVRLYSYKNDLVIDCFGGSGSTAVAALRLGRRFVHIDKSPTYCAETKERIEEEKAKLEKSSTLKKPAVKKAA